MPGVVISADVDIGGSAIIVKFDNVRLVKVGHNGLLLSAAVVAAFCAVAFVRSFFRLSSITFEAGVILQLLWCAVAAGVLVGITRAMIHLLSMFLHFTQAYIYRKGDALRIDSEKWTLCSHEGLNFAGVSWPALEKQHGATYGLRGALVRLTLTASLA
jgi:hypothetical protein